jgi:hypothetical protein
MTQIDHHADCPVTTSEAEYGSAIGKAIWHFRTGRRLPMDLAQELIGEGFDVYALEARYSA